MINPANATSGLVFKSHAYGSSQFVSVQSQKGTFVTTDTLGNAKQRSNGVDAVATVNGALTVGDGLNLKANTTGLDVELTEKMAENLEVKVEFIQTTFDGLIAGIQAGKCDISLSGVTPRGTRALAVSFAKPMDASWCNRRLDAEQARLWTS